MACRLGFKVGIGIGRLPCELSFCSVPPRRFTAELLLRRCLPKSYPLWYPLPEKKLVFEAVMGVLGVLLAARFGGGVRVRLSTSSEGAANEEMRLLTGVSRGSKFNGGSLMGCRSFLLECCIVGVLSGSALAPTVSPRLCLMEPVLELKCEASFPTCSSFRPPYTLVLAEEGFDADGVLGFAEVENENVWRSGSFGDSKALGMAGTGGTSSVSPPAELCTFRGFAVGSRELWRVGLVRSGIEEPPTFKELMLEVEDKEMPEAYDLRFCSGVARAEDGVSLFLMDIDGD